MGSLENRSWLTIATLPRLGFIPTAIYGSEGGILLGVSNRYLTVCIFTIAPKEYKGPEQNALGNLLVLFLILGLFGGSAAGWLWLIGKGW